jgi:hypothetical protein
LCLAFFQSSDPTNGVLVPINETDTQSHMLGIQVFVSARSPRGVSGSLSEAAFWVGLRQEIYSAVINHNPVQLKLEQYNVDRSLEHANDFVWANRAVVHCADVLNFCFGTKAISMSRWQDLQEYNKGWREQKPATFTPTYYREADREKYEVFPEVWYVNTCHGKRKPHVECTMSAELHSHWGATSYLGADVSSYIRPKHAPSRGCPEKRRSIHGGAQDPEAL